MAPAPVALEGGSCDAAVLVGRAMLLLPPAPTLAAPLHTHEAAGAELGGERLRGPRSHDLEGGRYLDTPEHDATVVSRAALTSGVRQ
jgi:hypothetical protein